MCIRDRYKGKRTEKLSELSAEEKRGLKFALIAFIVTIIAIALLVVPSNGVLRNPVDGQILKSPFMDSIVLIIAIVFLAPGIAYGYGARKIKNSNNIIDLMAKSMATMGVYIVLVFFAAQFVEYFTYTNLGTVIAVKGAGFLKTIGLTGLPLIIVFIVVAAFINIFMGSASAKWAIICLLYTSRCV